MVEGLVPESELLRRLERLSLVARRLLRGLLRGERRSKRRGSSVEFADFRQYTQGEDPRYIDWNAYARLENLFVKVFVEEEELLVWILLDTSASMGFGAPTKLTYAAHVALALAYIALTSHDRVSLWPVGESPKPHPLLAGRSSILRLFETAGSLRPSGTADFHKAAKLLLASTKRRGLVFLISDLMLRQDITEPLHLLHWAGFDVVVLHILLPEEVTPSPNGDLLLIDSETGEKVPISPSRKMLALYRRHFEQVFGALRDYCMGLSIPYVRATTDVEFDDFVLLWLRKAAVLR